MDTKQILEKAGKGCIPFYPLTNITSVKDPEGQINLAEILNKHNHFYIENGGNKYNCRAEVPLFLRRYGLWISYQYGGKLYTEYFKGCNEDAQRDARWTDDDYWEYIPDLEYIEDASLRIPTGAILPEHLSPALQQFLSCHHTIINFVDDEDLFAGPCKIIKFKDRKYQPAAASGKGYKILRKNFERGINVLFQEDVNESFTIYEVRYDFDLQGLNIKLPENASLYFKGGSLNNGTVTFNGGTIIGANKFTDCGNAIFNGVFNKGLIMAFDKELMWWDGTKWIGIGSSNGNNNPDTPLIINYASAIQVNMLPYGSSPTAQVTYADNKFNFILNIPKAKDGKDGVNGTIQGDGTSISIDDILKAITASADIRTLDDNSQPSVSVTANNGNLHFSFAIPKGKDGADGKDGHDGVNGKDGEGQPVDGKPGLTMVTLFANATIAKSYIDGTANVNDIPADGGSTGWSHSYDSANIDYKQDIYQIHSYQYNGRFATAEEGNPLGEDKWTKPMIYVYSRQITDRLDWSVTYLMVTNEDLETPLKTQSLVEVTGIDLSAQIQANAYYETVNNYLINSNFNNVSIANADNIDDANKYKYRWLLLLWFDGDNDQLKSYTYNCLTPIVKIEGEGKPGEDSQSEIKFRYAVGAPNPPALDRTAIAPEGWSETIPEYNTSAQTVYYIIARTDKDGNMIYDNGNCWSEPSYYAGKATEGSTGPRGPQGFQGVSGVPGVGMRAVFMLSNNKDSIIIKDNETLKNIVIEACKNIGGINTIYNDRIVSTSYSGALSSLKDGEVLGKNVYMHCFNCTSSYNVETKTEYVDLEDGTREPRQVNVYTEIWTPSNSYIASAPLGEQGNAGKILYPAGVWDASKDYVTTDNAAPYVIHGADIYFLNLAPGIVSRNQEPGSNNNPDANPSVWQKMEDFEAIYSKYAILGAGSFGSMCFYKDWMFSQQGHDKGTPNVISSDYQKFEGGDNWTPEEAAWIPQYAVNCKTGAVFMAGGNIKINADSSGNIGDNIEWSKNGNVRVYTNTFVFNLVTDNTIVVPQEELDKGYFTAYYNVVLNPSSNLSPQQINLELDTKDDFTGTYIGQSEEHETISNNYDDILSLSSWVAGTSGQEIIFKVEGFKRMTGIYIIKVHHELSL